MSQKLYFHFSSQHNLPRNDTKRHTRNFHLSSMFWVLLFLESIAKSHLQNNVSKRTIHNLFTPPHLLTHYKGVGHPHVKNFSHSFGVIPFTKLFLKGGVLNSLLYQLFSFNNSLRSLSATRVVVLLSKHLHLYKRHRTPEISSRLPCPLNLHLYKGHRTPEISSRLPCPLRTHLTLCSEQSHPSSDP